MIEMLPRRFSMLPRVFCPLLLLLGTATASAAPLAKQTTHYGLCDASAAVALDNSLFVLGGDEDNVLRVYRRGESGKALQEFDLTDFVKPAKKNPEVDIEGAAQLGDTVFWIGSHGTNKNGKPAPNRRRLFATKFTMSGGRVAMEPVGNPYTTLVDDLVSAPHLKKYKFAEAASTIPKSPEGLNIEGLAATPDGKLLIGFRAPIVEGKALIIPLDNPGEVIQRDRAKLGTPVELDLGGLGIRSIDYWPARKEYLIVAGPYAKGSGRVYLWSGQPDDGAREVTGIDLKGWAIEAAIIYPDLAGRSAQLVSDDGAMPECEDLKKGEIPRFRAGWITVPR
jgi:hypothetical protein